MSEVGYMAHRQTMLHTPGIDQDQCSITTGPRATTFSVARRST